MAYVKVNMSKAEEIKLNIKMGTLVLYYSGAAWSFAFVFFGLLNFLGKEET